MSKPLERYQKLVLKESLPKIHRYPFARKELSLILRCAYKKFLSLVFQDTFTTFCLLLEALRPKQKKNMAVAEYKNAMVAHKLPQDVLVQGFLDMQSLVYVGLVCYSDNTQGDYISYVRELGIMPVEGWLHMFGFRLM
ncbi:F-box protein [Pyrus ussuriensis x Pyrus communis]|uniref:F-box protein n=1 Tax=Pyrus ussuriensis x Pyrus communis TaxID=2448454 RepID=A0A5N5G730_9ROSA|nr:F-box protein [Pyrus ussuriensis x Pyrus communis]